MFHTGKNLISIVLVVISLIPLNIGFCQNSSQVRIFSTAFHNTAPTGIPTDVNHGTEHPVNTCSSGFLGRYPGHTFHQIRVPGSGECQWDWKYGLMTMNHIHPEDERNTGSGRKGYFLALSQKFRIPRSVNASQEPLPQEFGILILLGHSLSRYESWCGMQVELTDFLLHCHLGHEAINVIVHFGLWAAG